jgi:glycosyltransferase involved in cell wall biosynthesis
MFDSYQYSDVAIGITTFNRHHFIESCARSLSRATGIEHARILINDDCSTDYDLAFLETCFPPGAEIERHSANSGGADYACRKMVERLCGTGAKIFIILDSDLICARDFLDQTLALIKTTDGFLSLFNTPSHPAIGARGGLLLKEDVGAAGTVWTAELARAMLAATPEGRTFDWRFCDYLRQARIDILTVKASLVQHLGFAEGQNSSDRGGDIGIGFTDVDSFNAYLMQQEFAHALNQSFKMIAKRFDQQQLILEAHMRALKGTFDVLQEAHRQIAQLQVQIDLLGTAYEALREPAQ